MTRDYARDPMGNGQDLPAEIQQALVPGLRAHPTTLIFLAFRDDEAVGIVTGFLGFSTFAARPLINIHDLHVTKAHRGHGIGPSLLDAVEAEGRRLGCCKLTLEVQEHNETARDCTALRLRRRPVRGGGRRRALSREEALADGRSRATRFRTRPARAGPGARASSG